MNSTIEEVFVRHQTAALAAAIIILGGCSPAPPAPSGAATPTGVPVAAPTTGAPTRAAASPPATAVPPTPAGSPSPQVAAAPASPAPSPAAAELTGDGRTYPGPYFLGRADAPVTLEEYADFQ